MEVRKRAGANETSPTPTKALFLTGPHRRKRKRSDDIWERNISFLIVAIFLSVALFALLLVRPHEYVAAHWQNIRKQQQQEELELRNRLNHAKQMYKDILLDGKEQSLSSKGGTNHSSAHGQQQSLLDEKGRTKSNNGEEKEKKMKFVTVVMPSVVNLSGRKKRLDAIADTWGPLVRAIFVVHKPSEYPPAAAQSANMLPKWDPQNILHETNNNNQNSQSSLSPSYPRLLVIPPTISDSEGVQRLQYVIRTISLDLDPDFAFLVNDHTYVIPEHLCAYVSHFNPDEDLYAGHALRNDANDYAFNSGAAGYILSRQTMKRLIQTWEEGKDQQCVLATTTSSNNNHPHHSASSKFLQGNPGLLTAKCLHHSLHVHPLDTRDNDGSGRHKFHAYGLLRTITGHVDDWYMNKHRGLDSIFGLDQEFHHMPQALDQCCSSQTISFHYVEFAETRVLTDVLDMLRLDNEMTDQTLRDTIVRLWPRDWHDLGGYSQGLPHERKDEEWMTLLRVLRRISLSTQTFANTCSS